MSILKPDMTNLERKVLDEALTCTYRQFGITTANKSLEDPLNHGKYKEMPTLENLYNNLSGKGGAGLQEVLHRFVYGSARSFNASTNVNLDNPYVVIDISDMPKELISVGMFIANDFVFDKLRENITEAKALFNDEISRMIGIAGSAAAAESVLNYYKLLRSYNCIVVSATQDTNDFFALNNGVYGKGIIANSQMQIILKQKRDEARTLAGLLDLSEQEERNLQYYDRGDALLIANRDHVEIHVVASPLEDELINTDPETIKSRGKASI